MKVAERVKKSDQEWRQELGDEEYRVLREKGTEPPFTGKYWDEKDPGIYRCRGCGTPLFTSETKYDSGCGWPSFFEPANEQNIETRRDLSHLMVRTEVLCAACGGHLGHVFPDGPRPTGLRYCINSASLDLDRSGRGRLPRDAEEWAAARSVRGTRSAILRASRARTPEPRGSIRWSHVLP